MRAVLFFLRGKWREAWLLRCLSPAGFQLYLALQDVESWEFERSLTGHSWVYTRASVHIGINSTTGKLMCNSAVLLPSFDQLVLMRELRMLENRKLATVLIRAVAR